VLRELMAYVERGVFATFANQWQFWYGKLGIPMPEGFVPQSKS
jgi:predicted solute-binding protein